MTHLIQIVPGKGVRLFERMVRKEAELARLKRGTFFRCGSEDATCATWSHVVYRGRVRFQRSAGEVVTVEVKARRKAGDEWQLLQAFVGFMDRHFGESIRDVNIQFRE